MIGPTLRGALLILTLLTAPGLAPWAAGAVPASDARERRLRHRNRSSTIRSAAPPPGHGPRLHEGRGPRGIRTGRRIPRYPAAAQTGRAACTGTPVHPGPGVVGEPAQAQQETGGGPGRHASSEPRERSASSTPAPAATTYSSTASRRGAIRRSGSFRLRPSSRSPRSTRPSDAPGLSRTSRSRFSTDGSSDSRPGAGSPSSWSSPLRS